MKKFDLFNKFNNPVLIVNSSLELIYKNNVFNRCFSDFKSLKTFLHKINYDICPLNSDDTDIHSPIIQAVRSKESFVAHISYQYKQNEFSYYDINSVKRNNYTIIFFTDVTSQIKYERLLNKQNQLQNKLNILKVENKNLQDVKQKAQSQAIKMALINKISNIINESIDINCIIEPTLKELSFMFGAFKAYYASYNKNTFTITQSINKLDLNISVRFDSSVLKSLNNNQISYSRCLKEHLDAEGPLVIGNQY